MNKDILRQVTQAISTKGKGILAADESTPTIAKRFASIQVESTEENRRAYRECLLTTPGLEAFISGVILFEETLGQATQNNQLFVEYLKEKGIIPGIKVDKGLVALEGTTEMVTQGLEGLTQRLDQYQKQGAQFAKWRAVFQIGDNHPSQTLIVENARRLAQYAKQCQSQGIVPIVEPEILIDGDHTLQTCAQVTAKVLESVFAKLDEHEVDLECMILKPSMVIPGKDCPTKAHVSEVAQKTLEIFNAQIPKQVPSINFLSGGQTPQQATEHLNALNQAQQPWHLSFSYGRALQEPCLKTWQGKTENIEKAQKALYQRAKLNSLATLGDYQSDMETP